MICTKCGGKIRVVDTYHSNNNEIYRRRKCDDCGRGFYTVEFEVDDDERLKQELRSTHRWKQSHNNAQCSYLRAIHIRKITNQVRNAVCPTCSDNLCDGKDEDCPKIKRWVDAKIKKENNNAR